MGGGNEMLAVVTARVGPLDGADDRRHLPGQGGHAEHQLRILVEGVPHLIWRSCERGQWTWASPQWAAYTGQGQGDSQGRGWLDVVHPDDRERALAAWEAASPHGEVDIELRLRRASDGAWAWHRAASLPLRDASGRVVEWLGSTTEIQAYKDLQALQQERLAAAERHAQVLQEEITRRRRAEVQLAHAASHDGLTDLHNRAWFMRRLGEVMAAAEAASPGCSVLFVDLDDFASVNDTLGHQAGDQLLAAIGQRLRRCLEPRSTLARLGGDEFAVLVEGDGNAETALRLAQRFAEAMRDPVRFGALEAFSSCSMGIAHAAAGACTPEELVRDADTAMYWAKREGAKREGAKREGAKREGTRRGGRGGYAVFTEAMRDEAAVALALQAELRRAIERGEFVLHYQPICDAATKRPVAVEALVRWRHPERGEIGPASFIPAAERAGLIRDIGRWVLREACLQAGAWHGRYPGVALRLGVNASGEEVRDRRYLGEVRDILAETGLEPGRLQLEVTEGVFLDQPEVAGEVLGGLRALGVRVALDDFGTGTSSLGCLDRYPVDALKIDRSFVAGMLVQPRTRAVVETIIRLGQAMDLLVVAEGVEEEAQLQALHDAGCGLVQGFLLAPPLPAEGIEAMLARGPVLPHGA